MKKSCWKKYRLLGCKIVKQENTEQLNIKYDELGIPLRVTSEGRTSENPWSPIQDNKSKDNKPYKKEEIK